jgi:hypothetical protein
MYTKANGAVGTPGTLTLRLDHLRAGVAMVHAIGCLDPTTAPALQRLLDERSIPPRRRHCKPFREVGDQIRQLHPDIGHYASADRLF